MVKGEKSCDRVRVSGTHVMCFLENGSLGRFRGTPCRAQGSSSLKCRRVIQASPARNF